MVIRKYFALSLVAASLAMAGCSSDDDDSNGDTTGGTSTAGTATAGTSTAGTATAGTSTAGTSTGGTATAGTSTGGGTPVEDTTTRDGNSILDLARGTSDTDDSDPDDDDDELEGGVDDLSALVGALGDYPALLNLLDDETATLTVFAPNNDALDGVDTSDADALENTLAYHVVEADEGEMAFNTSAIDAGVTFPLTLTTAAGADATVDIVEVDGGGYAVVDSEGNEVALGQAVDTAANGVVYIIDSVLVAPEPMDPGGTTGTDGGTDAGGTDGGTGGGTAAPGTPLRAVQDDPTLSGFLTLLEDSDFDQSLQDANNNSFVTFAPTNDELDDSATTAAVYIDTNATLTDDSIPPGTYSGTGTGAKQFVVEGVGPTLTVNGLPATFVTRGDGGALVKYGN